MSTELQKALPRLFGVLFLALLALAAWQWRNGPPVSANLLELLPSSAPDAIEQQAEQRMQEPLNRELVVLVGHAKREQALRLAAELGQRWQDEAAFAKVQWNLQPDLTALRQQLLAQRPALLGRADRQQLLDDPQGFMAQRAADLFDPFRSHGLLPTEQDWLGLGARIEKHLPAAHNLQLDLSGALLAEDAGKTWVLLRAQSHVDAFDGNLARQVANLVQQARQNVQAQGGELLASSGLLFSAHGQRQASHEMSLMGGLASVAALLLLLVVFRRARVLLAFLPVAVGVLSGLSACVALFGHIHVLTLVLGASLIGVAIDYPLHLLSKSWTLQPWDSWRVLRATLLGLSLGLLTNVIGYLALACTPFPALTQVAVFSAAGLLGAYLCSICLLPALLGRTPIHPWAAPLRLAAYLLAWREALLRRVATPWLLLLLVLFCIGGLSRLSLKDDLRQWAASAPELLQQSQRLGRIVGVQPTSQFYLVRGDDQEQLLRRQQQLAERLDRLVAAGQLHSYLSLSQIVAPPSHQQALRTALPSLLKASQPLQALGVPQAALAEEVAALQAAPISDIDSVLRGPLGEPWRPLWLGQAQGQVVGLVSLQGLSDASLLADQAQGLPGVKLIDRLGELNQLFAATQTSAAELKLAACLLIFLVLCMPFGIRGAARILSVSLLAALAAMACLGWLGQTLTLFSLFGLLLVTAIGVDYAILMHERVGGTATSLLGTLLAALTTWLSFGLLALSSTPAVSNFGLTISIGLSFTFLLSPWAGSRHAADNSTPTLTSITRHEAL